MTSLTDAAAELYGTSPTEFVSARTALAVDARAAGDRELMAQVKGLRKPSASAWLLNQLVRHRRDEIEQLLSLGSELRNAQDELDRVALRSLTEQRRALVSAMAEAGGSLARELGNPVNRATLDEVEQSLQAAMADAAASDALRTGTLLRALSATGFDPVDLAGAVAAPHAESASPVGGARASDASTARAERRTRDLAEAREEEADTARWEEETAARLHEVETRLAAVDDRRDAVERAQRELRTRLTELEEESAELQHDRRELDRTHEGAARAAASARRSADRARERLQRLS